MFAVIDRLRTLKVTHVMAKTVVEISGKQTMRDVAQQFAEHEISSAPVIDERRRCVGMLSAADYMTRVCRQPRRVGAPSNVDPNADTVERYMATDIQSIGADASLLDAARAMSDAHVHRLPVLEGDRVVGIVSTMDIVAAMLNAVDELNASQPMDF